MGIAEQAQASVCDKDVKCTLQADAVPTDQPWTEPAKIAYTFNNGGKDSVAIDLSGKGIFDLGFKKDAIFGLLEATFHRNNQQKKEQNNLLLSAGFHYEYDNTPDNGPIGPNNGNFSLWIDGKLGYNRKAVYADPSSSQCVAQPTAVFCKTQHVESIRGTLDFSPHWKALSGSQSYKDESKSDVDGPALAYDFGIGGTLFIDDAINNTTDPTSGKLVTGTVTGARLLTGLALSPKFTKYRLVGRVSAQLVPTFSRQVGRREEWGRTTHLITASLDYDFSDRSVIGGAPSFKPSIGITFTDGSDPLAGRKDQSTFVIAFKIAYK